MTPTPILTFAPKIDPEAPAWLRQHLNLIYQKLGNHTQAFGIIAGKLSPSSPAAAQTVQEIINASGGSGSIIPPPPGGVNNKTGVTSYATVAGDNGLLIVFSDASAIAVTLTTQTQPWFAWIANQGAGTATLTPATGTISYAGNPGAASMALDGGYSCLVAFDGTDWWAWTEPAGTGGTITDVIAGTGLTGGGTGPTVTLALATPVSVADGGTGTATPGLIAGSNITITGSWPDQTIAATGSGGGGRGGTPTVVVGAAAGSGASASFGAGSLDLSGVLVIVAGTGPSSGVLATITLSAPVSGFAIPTWSPTSATVSTQLVSAGFWAGPIDNQHWEIVANAAFTTPGTYDFSYAIAP